jgi:predicted MPP superfamily phosphohydrolase
MTERRFWQKSPFDVPLLRSLASRARANGAFDAADPGEDPLPGRIRLRRFAGARAHAELMTTPLRIVHLTDIHVGRVTPMRVQRAAVELTNEQKADLVVMTGDFVCHSQEYLDALEEIVGSIKAPVIGVLGNHDHWSGAAEVRRALRRARVEVLDNAHTIVTIRGQRLQVVGLDDAYTGHADQARAVRGLRKNLPVLGLSHIAEEADALWNRGVPLVLSGHTHAGQVTLAGLHELALGRWAGHKYVHGLYGSRTPSEDTPKGAVYVGAGIGASVMPLRLGERGRREVTVFELGMAPGTIDERMEEQPALPGRPPTPEQKRKRAAKVLKKAARRARWNLRRQAY